MKPQQNSVASWKPTKTAFRHSFGDTILVFDSPRFSSQPLGTRIPARGWVEDDWRARTSPERPWPVMLVHGTSVSNGDFHRLATKLRELGWAVFIPAYGQRATNPIEDSAAQISAYIDMVLYATRSEKIILVGHSQGGVLGRYYIKRLNGASKVKHLISLASPHHGTSLGGMLSGLVHSDRSTELMHRMIDGYFGPAGNQQIIGSKFLTELNSDGDIVPGPGYTCFATRTDSTVVPAESGFLAGPGVNNAWIQDHYPLTVVLHEDMPRNRHVRSLVVNTIEQLRPVS